MTINNCLFSLKGILGNVTLGGQVLDNWSMTSLPLDNEDKLLNYVRDTRTRARLDKTIKHQLSHQGLTNQSRVLMIIDQSQGLISDGKMTFWSGEFLLGNNDLQVKDTFLSLSGWHKGVAWINGFNLGRWPIRAQYLKWLTNQSSVLKMIDQSELSIKDDWPIRAQY